MKKSLPHNHKAYCDVMDVMDMSLPPKRASLTSWRFNCNVQRLVKVCEDYLELAEHKFYWDGGIKKGPWHDISSVIFIKFSASNIFMLGRHSQNSQSYIGVDIGMRFIGSIVMKFYSSLKGITYFPKMLLQRDIFPQKPDHKKIVGMNR